MSFDIQQLHPTMVARNDRLEADCEARGWTIGATRVTADYGQQKQLYNLYRSGRGNLAANPDALGVISPWGWQVHGSFHQIQHDTYSHAIDYTIYGCTWAEFHEVANRHGIGFPLFAQGLGEPWHAQWWDERGIYIDHAGDDDMAMSDDDMRRLAGFIAEALDGRARTVHSYRDGGECETTAKTLEEWTFAEGQQATIAAQGLSPK